VFAIPRPGLCLVSLSAGGQEAHLDYTSCADKIVVRVPLPAGSRVIKSLVNESRSNHKRRQLKSTVYATAQIEGRGCTESR